MADNHAKGISESPHFTSHANAKFSRQNWDASEADIIRALECRAALSQSSARIAQTQLKKWRYSVPLDYLSSERRLIGARICRRLAFAGDAFGGRGRVEGAFTVRLWRPAMPMS